MRLFYLLPSTGEDGNIPSVVRFRTLELFRYLGSTYYLLYSHLYRNPTAQTLAPTSNTIVWKVDSWRVQTRCSGSVCSMAFSLGSLKPTAPGVSHHTFTFVSKSDSSASHFHDGRMYYLILNSQVGIARKNQNLHPSLDLSPDPTCSIDCSDKH